jgi:DNA-binding NarL/FixJ family response regulator
MPLGSTLAVEERTARREIAPRGLLGELTSRERMLVELSVKGLSYAEIGLRMNISEGTTKSYASHITEKTGVSRGKWAAMVFQQRVEAFCVQYAGRLTGEMLRDLQAATVDPFMDDPPAERWLS